MKLISTDEIVVKRHYYGEKIEGSLLKGKVKWVKTTVRQGDRLLYSELLNTPAIMPKPLIDYLNITKKKQLGIKMEKEILKQRIKVLEKENKELLLSKGVIECSNSDLVEAMENICPQKQQVQILKYVMKNVINRAIVLSITNYEENEQKK